MNAPKRIFVTDCEGPVSKNDNAYELTEHFVPRGSVLFALVSKYDDVQADVVKREGYKAGDTLKLILPFLKAYDVTNKKIKEFSAKNIILIPHAKDMLQFVSEIMPSFIVSTSYEQYMQALCETTDFPFENVYCTKLNIDKYQLNETEKEKLKQLKEEIASMPIVEIPENATSIEDFSKKDKKTIERLNEIFWQEILEMECGKILKEVNPVGGFEKTKAIREVAARLGVKLSDVVYVGDSITDVQSFQLMRENGGLAVSFNGNSYAVREAEVAVLSQNATVTSILAEAFSQYGRKGVLELIKDWSCSSLMKRASPFLQRKIAESYLEALPKVEIITDTNKEKLMKESTTFRKTVRGKTVGGLG
jgi:energy-converting hydrogenase A subunit R